MMKTAFIFILNILCSCALGSHEEVVQDEKIINEKEEIYENHNKKTCHVISSEQIKDCVLFKLKCEDESNDFILKCSNRPFGEISNPPRPL